MGSKYNIWIGVLILQTALNFFQRHRKTGFYQVWLILYPALRIFVSTEYFILGLQYLLRTEKLALGEVFFVIIHAPVVLGSSYTKIKIFFPSALFNLQKLIQVKYAHIRETGT